MPVQQGNSRRGLRSPEHARAWASIGRSWRLIGEVATHRRGMETGTRRGAEGAFRGADIPYRSGWRRIAGIAVVAACVAFLALSAPSFMHLRLQADHPDRHGGKPGDHPRGWLTTVTLGTNEAPFTRDCRQCPISASHCWRAFFEVRRGCASLHREGWRVPSRFWEQSSTSAYHQHRHRSARTWFCGCRLRPGRHKRLNAHLAPGEMMRRPA